VTDFPALWQTVIPIAEKRRAGQAGSSGAVSGTTFDDSNTCEMTSHRGAKRGANSALEYEESEDTGARAELRVDEEGYWWVRYMSPFGDRISEVHDDENSAWARYQELVQRVAD
jgi:hypothetical protein